jgi:uncharacterized protein (UPF0371 family)
MSIDTIAPAFNSDKYFNAQMDAFRARILPDTPNIIEFGGKPFGDYHASRVLPGYEEDIKADIIRCVSDEMGNTCLALVVNARDILRDPDGRRISKRIRGDSQLTYDDEVIRIGRQAHDEFGINVSDVVISVVPSVMSTENADYLGEYIERLEGEFSRVTQLPMMQGYPNTIPTGQLSSVLGETNPLTTDENLIIMSPGGGSGKFGVAAREIAHYLMSGRVPNFIKFETFPVFNLPLSHPLNVAFLAATADLPNQLTMLENGQTNYDKDVENLALLRQLIAEFPELNTSILEFAHPTDMGVNVIETGITDEWVVADACRAEVKRRLERYKGEQARGVETQQTVERVLGYMGMPEAVGQE